jgi:hypothetical protein
MIQILLFDKRLYIWVDTQISSKSPSDTEFAAEVELIIATEKEQQKLFTSTVLEKAAQHNPLCCSIFFTVKRDRIVVVLA